MDITAAMVHSNDMRVMFTLSKQLSVCVIDLRTVRSSSLSVGTPSPRPRSRRCGERGWRPVRIGAVPPACCGRGAGPRRAE